MEHECPDDNPADKTLSFENDVHLFRSRIAIGTGGMMGPEENVAENKTCCECLQPVVPVNGEPPFLRELSAHSGARCLFIDSRELGNISAKEAAKRNCSSNEVRVKRGRAPRGKLARHVLAPRVSSYTALHTVVSVKEMRLVRFFSPFLFRQRVSLGQILGMDEIRPK